MQKTEAAGKTGMSVVVADQETGGLVRSKTGWNTSMAQGPDEDSPCFTKEELCEQYKTW